MDERVRKTVATYEDIADTYAEIHDDRSVVADLVAGFRDAVGDTAGPDARVLDVGCGPGWETATFEETGFDAVGFDLTTEFLADARERAPEATWVRGDMRQLPFADATFDGLWACASLLHVPRADVGPTVAEFERVLRPGGVALVSLKRDPDKAGTPEDSLYEADDRHFEYYEPETVRALLADAGTTVEWLDDEGGWVAALARTE